MSKKVQIKQKIKSIQTTKKVTHAIRLVSMSLYAKLEHQEPFVKHYVDNLSKLFVELAGNTSDSKETYFGLPQKNNASPLFVVIATTKGLCGGLNSNLFKYLVKELSKDTIKSAKFITVGLKAYNFVKDNLSGDILCNYNDFNSNNFTLIANDIMTKIANFYPIIFYFNKPRSFFTQKPTTLQLIPVSNEALQKNITHSKPTNNSSDLIWEQNKLQVLDFMLDRLIKSQITTALLQALIAEYSARFLAMDSSTNNAEKYLEKLTLQYNKIRQGTITREVSELCGTFLEQQ